MLGTVDTEIKKDPHPVLRSLQYRDGDGVNGKDKVRHVAGAL